MEIPQTQSNALTPAQQQAVTARGNVLVMAGAGTGKTKTLVGRCLACLAEERASLDELLVVTFTEAAAAEMRQRLRRELEDKAAASPDDAHWPRQLALFDLAHVGTLHSFCLRLVREHFYELGLDPQPMILDQGEARQRADETLDELLQSHYDGRDEFSPAVQNLIQIHGGGRDQKIRTLILRLHHYSQTRPDAAGWLVEQIQKFSAPEPIGWQNWLLTAIEDWRAEWLSVLEKLKGKNEKAAELADILSRWDPGSRFTRELAAEVLQRIISADQKWPARRKTILRAPLDHLFSEAAFLASLAAVKSGGDPLAEDWSWVRDHMKTLVRLAQEFAQQFSMNKLADGVLDFHDLEQFALKLLWDFAGDQPTASAKTWRNKFRFVFVDEYQDINAAQDKIIAALSRDGAKANRFLVGDVKQSIYRFRLADPKIFRDYAREWNGANGQVISLSENFRSHESLLSFVNSVFALLMRGDLGGVAYDEDAKLKFASPETRNQFAGTREISPRTELLLRFKTDRSEEAQSETGPDELADLSETEKEARLLAIRLREMRAQQHEIWDDAEKIFRVVEWRDMAVLLRAMSGKSEIYAMEFERAGVPLMIARAGFYESSEVTDLLSLLQLLDNPLQDVPCIAVLRSPLVGLSLDELAAIRITLSRGHFWTALIQAHNSGSKISDETRIKVGKFLERFARWRKLARQISLSRGLEQVLSETHYADWLRSRPRGEQRHSNVGNFLNLAQKFDQFQRKGLYRFLKFIAARREAELEPEVPAGADENAVRLMSIHQSKGLEFPVVALADLAKKFNTQDQHGEIIFDERFGLCPRVKPPQTERRYSSLPHWLAQRHLHREQAGEELRLLYVAMTRARDTLILTGSVGKNKWTKLWQESDAVTFSKILSAKSYADWFGLWFAQQFGANPSNRGELLNLRWQIVEDTELLVPGNAEDNQQKSVGLPALGEAALEKLQAALTWQYAFPSATEQAAKSSVTALRRQAADELEDEAEDIFRARRNLRSKLSAADTGTAHHKFLQHVSLEKIGELAALEAEAGRLNEKKILSAQERQALDLAAVAAFWSSDEGQKIRQQAGKILRELTFTARFSPRELSEIIGTKLSPGLENEFVVVQGVADLVVLLPAEIWLVDFKTDVVQSLELTEKIKMYSPQLKLYARALSKIYSRPVTHCWLHFLSARRTERLNN